MTELRECSLLVELANASQSRLIWKVKTLDATNVEIQPHETLNQIKGTIWYQNKPGYFEDNITKELKEKKTFLLCIMYQEKSQASLRRQTYIFSP